MSDNEQQMNRDTWALALLACIAWGVLRWAGVL